MRLLFELRQQALGARRLLSLLRTLALCRGERLAQLGVLIRQPVELRLQRRGRRLAVFAD